MCFMIPVAYPLFGIVRGFPEDEMAIDNDSASDRLCFWIITYAGGDTAEDI